MTELLKQNVQSTHYNESDLYCDKKRINLDPENVQEGLAQLILTLIKLIHELLERQAIRRIQAGYLTEKQIERLGLTLMYQAKEIERLCSSLNLVSEDLNFDLGPLGKLL